MSSKLKLKLVHWVVAAGLLLAFVSAPTLPAPDGECSYQTATCTG